MAVSLQSASAHCHQFRWASVILTFMIVVIKILLFIKLLRIEIGKTEWIITVWESAEGSLTCFEK